jgi:hypothetical protein
MPTARRRSAFATWLAVFGGLAIALGVTGLWAQRTLGDPETFAGLAGEILEDEKVRSELAVVIVDPVLDEATPEIQQQRAFIVATTTTVLGDRRFVPLFRVLRRGRRLLEGDGQWRSTSAGRSTSSSEIGRPRGRRRARVDRQAGRLGGAGRPAAGGRRFDGPPARSCLSWVRRSRARGDRGGPSRWSLRRDARRAGLVLLGMLLVSRASCSPASCRPPPDATTDAWAS